MAPKVNMKATASKPKRRRGANDQTFVNDKAEEVYTYELVSREGIRERGIWTSYTAIKDIIEERKWEKLTAHPNNAVMPVVREFYANARFQLQSDPHERKVLVRGKSVPFDHAAINSFFELEDNEEDDYSAWVAQNPDDEQVLAGLTKPGGAWTKQGNFKRQHLRFLSKAWHYFIVARLLPTTHVSDVTRDRAQLNFAIQNRLSINIGKIIEQSIISFATGRVKSSLGHPTLICELCLLAGVQFQPNEEVQAPMPLIDDAAMELYEKTSLSKSTERASASTQQGSRSSSGLATVEQIRELRKENAVTRATLQRHTQQLDYLVEWTKAMSVNFQAGSSSMTFPTPGDFDQVPEEEEDDEDEDSDD